MYVHVHVCVYTTVPCVQYSVAGGTAYISCVQYLAAGGTAYTFVYLVYNT